MQINIQWERQEQMQDFAKEKIELQDEVQQKEAKTLLKIMQEQGVFINANCNGNGTCGKCKVVILNEKLPYTAEEQRLLGKEERERGVHLACRVVPGGDMTVVIPLDREEDIKAVAYISKENEQEEPQRNEDNVQKNEDVVKKDDYHIIVDLGTTTIAVALVSVAKAQIVAVKTGINHQRKYGADVLSRMEEALQGSAEELQRLVCADVAEGIQSLLEEQKLSAKRVTRIFLAGNTTMCHLLCGYECKGLSKAPFAPVSLELEEKNAIEFLKIVDLEAKLTIFPGISAFVGADIVADIYGAKLLEQKENILLLDMGTNGEMALWDGNRLYVTATAAGPAFEGGNLSCGMAAIPGAICGIVLETEDVREEKKCNVILQTIENQKPLGICGSGVIEIMAELKNAKLIDENGLLQEPYFETGFPLTWEKNNQDENYYAQNAIYFTQKDIREVQMAKAAIRAGIEILLKESGLTYSDVKKVYIAGGFGYYIHKQKAIAMGLLPEEFLDKWSAMGNGVLQGLLRYSVKKESENANLIPEKITEINLANHPDFFEYYINYMKL